MFGIGFRRNNHFNRSNGTLGIDIMCIIGFVCQKFPQLGERTDELRSGFKIMNLPAADGEAIKSAFIIGYGVYLCRSSPATFAHGLIIAPPFCAVAVW